MATWAEDITEALKQLGGEAHLSDINDKIKDVRSIPLTGNWKASIRGAIERNSSHSEAFSGKDIFYSVEGIGRGVWGLRDFVPNEENVNLTDDDSSFPEGKEMLKKHVLRERNPRLIFEAKKLFKQKHGKLFCEVCSFTFTDKYHKQIAEDFIEAHHTIPISELQENATTRISDLVMVCSNCHRMLHRRRPWLSKDDLKLLLI